MFTRKKTQLFETPIISDSKSTSVTSAFVDAGMKKSAETRSQNGALKYESYK